MDTPLQQALDRFVEQREQLLRQQNAIPSIEYDPDWPSSCYLDQPEPGGTTAWLPQRQQPSTDLFERLEHALEQPIHPDLIDYYTRYWSDPLRARSTQGLLDLLFVWNPADYERLRANLIGHALGRRRLKQPLTLFFGCTHPEEYVLTLDNASGQVMLEQPGRKASDILAPSLADFINSLTPVTD